ncbi:uncharacterized protein [Hyperolius riggenbachi]|uniref:uncharacterized protein isoform X2 n=1 Tax=Hyperolius riggenbachi TaxID=752182 RepID=UPI0035A3CD03
METKLNPNSDSRQHLYNEPWLELCLHETLLPGSSWTKVLDKVGAKFAIKVQPFLNETKERQIIFKLLGKEFVERYFSKYPNVPGLLSPPHIISLEYEKLERKKQILLKDLWTKAAEETGCHLSDDPAELSAEMTGFVNHTFNLVENKMNLILAQCETKTVNTYFGTDNEMLAWTRRRPKSVESKDLSFAMNGTEQFSLNSHKGNAAVNDKIPPPLSSAKGEVLGNALCTIMSSDLSTMTAVCNRLNGHLLPKVLREFIWTSKLLRAEKALKDEKIEIIEKETRERYGKALEHKCAELKLRSATRSPISGLIENAVVEKYGSTPSMYQFATNEHMIDETCKSLNILYVYNGTYEPYLVHWIFPLQIAFRQTPTSVQHPYELFMYLHLLIKNIFPSWLEIFAMAERVMDTLQTEDMELYSHLQRSFQRDITFDPKDFLTELIAQEREEALKCYAAKQKMGGAYLQGELLANPVIILRKWMGEGFVNSLDLPAVLLIWDQLFMQDWNRKVMESFCLILLMLLRDSILTADNYPAIRQVLLNDAYHLLTADIQRAWMHLQQGGLLADIPGMNRLGNRQVRELSPRLQGKVESRDFRKILPSGVKDIVLKVLLKEGINRSSDAWLKDFDPSFMRLTVSVYYGVAKLYSKTSALKPVLLNNARDSRDAKLDNTMLLQFDDKFEFESKDLSDYTNYKESRERPFLLLQALHISGEIAPQAIGWTKVDAFEKEEKSTQEIWKPREFSSRLSLHPGKEPDNINESTSGISKAGSYEPTIGFTVYDPTKDYGYKSINSSKDNTNTEEHDLSLIPPWVQHDETTLLPYSTTQDECFDLYIDALHFIPDCATITKVSAQILNPGSKSKSSVVAFPKLNSSARNPVFSFCQILNTEDEQLHPNTLIFFQVSTVDSDSRSSSIIGNCILRVFNDDTKLNVGGFQMRLRTGLPSKLLDSLVQADLQKYPAFPCCTLLVRILPHFEHSVPMPSYASGYYFTDNAKPTRSEMEIMSTFLRDTLYPKQVKDMAEHLIEKELSQVPEKDIIDWYKMRMGGEKSSLLQPSLNYSNIQHAVRYRQHNGLRLQIRQAFGLEVEGLYTNAFARILKGAQTFQLDALPQNWGGDEKLLTQNHDFTSLQRSPRWTDPSVVLHPYEDDNSVLLVQLFGMAATYVPHASRDQRGHVISNFGQELELQLLGWTAFPLFDGHYIKSGIHSAPLFQGVPNAIK